MAPVTADKKRRKFNPQTFLSTIDGGRTIATFAKKERVFEQGDVADAVFYIQKGKVRLSVVSKGGKEATIGILTESAFFGEGVPYRAALPDVFRNLTDRLHCNAHR